MENKEKYQSIFIEALGIDKKKFSEEIKYKKSKG